MTEKKPVLKAIWAFLKKHYPAIRDFVVAILAGEALTK